MTIVFEKPSTSVRAVLLSLGADLLAKWAEVHESADPIDRNVLAFRRLLERHVDGTEFSKGDRLAFDVLGVDGCQEIETAIDHHNITNHGLLREMGRAVKSYAGHSFDVTVLNSAFHAIRSVIFQMDKITKFETLDNYTLSNEAVSAAGLIVERLKSRGVDIPALAP